MVEFARVASVVLVFLSVLSFQRTTMGFKFSSYGSRVCCLRHWNCFVFHLIGRVSFGSVALTSGHCSQPTTACVEAGWVWIPVVPRQLISMLGWTFISINQYGKTHVKQKKEGFSGSQDYRRYHFRYKIRYPYTSRVCYISQACQANSCLS